MRPGDRPERQVLDIIAAGLIELHDGGDDARRARMAMAELDGIAGRRRITNQFPVVALVATREGHGHAPCESLEFANASGGSRQLSTGSRLIASGLSLTAALLIARLLVLFWLVIGTIVIVATGPCGNALGESQNLTLAVIVHAVEQNLQLFAGARIGDADDLPGLYVKRLGEFFQ